MAANRISFNIHARGVADVQKLISFHALQKPAWSLFMGDVNLARLCQAVSPNTNYIIRFRGVINDDKPHELYSPAQYVDMVQKELNGFNGWVYLNNESGSSDALIKWIVDTCEIGIKRGLRFVVWNPSVGSYDKPDFPRLLPLFKFASQNWQNIVIGLHEYFGAVVTSGFVGGAPDDPRHTNFIPEANWPQSIYNPYVTTFHCGRFRWLTEYCFNNGISNIRYVITEFGPDFLGDIREWLDGLPKTAPYTTISGIKTLKAAWASLYPNKSPLDIILSMIDYAQRVIYSDFRVEGILLYCFGNVDTLWEKFDFQSLNILEGLIPSQSPAPTQPPAPVIEVPTSLGDGITLTVSVPVGIAYYNVRYAPSIASPILGVIKPNDIVTLYPDTAKTDTAGNKYYFIQQSLGDSVRQGWAAYAGTIVQPPELGKIKKDMLDLLEREKAKAIASYDAMIAWVKTL